MRFIVFAAFGETTHRIGCTLLSQGHSAILVDYRPDLEPFFVYCLVFSLHQDRFDSTCERQIPGWKVLLFGSDEQQRELPVSIQDVV